MDGAEDVDGLADTDGCDDTLSETFHIILAYIIAIISTSVRTSSTIPSSQLIENLSISNWPTSHPSESPSLSGRPATIPAEHPLKQVGEHQCHQISQVCQSQLSVTIEPIISTQQSVSSQPSVYPHLVKLA